MNTTISLLSNSVDQSVTLNGWMFNSRFSGKIGFLELRDGTGTTQCIVNEKTTPAAFEIAKTLACEASVAITGFVRKHPKRDGVYEIDVQEISIYQNPTEEYPIGKKDHGPDFLLDHRHLWIRSSKQAAILRIRHTIMYAMFEYLADNGFTRLDAPIFTPSACEGTTTLFSVDYFDLGKAYLTQSGQLYLEAAISSLGRVYDFGPVFRAEKSKTRRHLIEFWMMDAEMPFCDQKQNMQIQEGLFVHVMEKVLAKHRADLAILERDVTELERVKAPFHHITHKDAVQKLIDAGFEAKFDDDFGADEEVALANMFDRPLFVENYPAGVKAFYMKRDPNDDTRVLCADVIVPGYGEVIGGSQREDDYDTLVKRILEHGLLKEDFSWYLDLRKFGSVPHSGFGVGLERLVTWICGLKHVRESIPFPRLINRKAP